MELKQQQEELAGILFSIDKILKRNLHIQTKLSKELQKHLMENISSTININLFNNIIKLQTEGKTKEDCMAQVLEGSVKRIEQSYMKQSEDKAKSYVKVGRDGEAVKKTMSAQMFLQKAQEMQKGR